MAQAGPAAWSERGDWPGLRWKSHQPEEAEGTGSGACALEEKENLGTDTGSEEKRVRRRPLERRSERFVRRGELRL